MILRNKKFILDNNKKSVHKMILKNKRFLLDNNNNNKKSVHYMPVINRFLSNVRSQLSIRIFQTLFNSHSGGGLGNLVLSVQ